MTITMELPQKSETFWVTSLSLNEIYLEEPFRGILQHFVDLSDKDFEICCTFFL